MTKPICITPTKPFNDVIAIDGPAGVGKSAVARLVAKKCGFLFVNTGDMYRALTWKAIKQGVNIRKSHDVVRFMNRDIDWKLRVDNGMLKVCFDGKDLGREIKSERVARLTPIVAQIPQVRRYLRRLQREIAMKGRVVLEGRDTTTHVVPRAQLKVHLDAPIEERARRRYQQLLAEGKKVKLPSIQEAVRIRDYQERTRGIMPKRLSAGTIRVDTTNLTLHEVADRIIQLYRKQKSHD